MEITLFKNFSKRRNSTKRPSLDDGLLLEARLKMPSSMENPVFMIDTTSFKNPDTNIDLYNGYNYLHALYHYYFIVDIVFQTNNIISIVCESDPMATHKQEILNYECFVERSASNYNNLVYDSSITPQTNIISSAAVNTALPFTKSNNYVLRIATGGGIQGKVLSSSELTSLMDFATSGDIIDSITDAGIKFLYDPAQYILGCMFFPISVINTGVGTSIKLGAYDTGVIAPTAVSGWSASTSLGIPSAYYGDFRDYDPRWSQYDAYLPGVGTIPIDPASARKGLNANVTVDYIDGGITYKITDGSGALVTTANGRIGVPYQIGGIGGSDAGGVIAGVAAMAAGAATGGAAGVAAATGGLIKAETAMLQHTVSIVGGTGNSASVQFNFNIIVSRRTLGTTGIPTSNVGRPLYQTVKLSTLSGYVQCGGASINIDGLGGDKDIINSYLNGGFYIE